jgi:hypothetical protein
MTRKAQWFALAFSTSLPPQEMYARVLSNTRWQWVAWSSERWGDYVWTTDVPGVPAAKVQLFAGEPEPGRCAVNVRFKRDASLDRHDENTLRGLLMSELLPSIDAREIGEIEYLE